MVEHIVHIDGVTGSSPVATTKIPGRKAWVAFYLSFSSFSCTIAGILSLIENYNYVEIGFNL